MESNQKYLTFPDDFRDELIGREMGFHPFTHRRSQIITELTGDVIRKTAAESATSTDN